MRFGLSKSEQMALADQLVSRWAGWRSVMPQTPISFLAIEAEEIGEVSELVEIDRRAFEEEWRLAIEMLERDLVALKTTS